MMLPNHTRPATPRPRPLAAWDYRGGAWAAGRGGGVVNEKVAVPTVLYHFTCDHGHAQIDGWVVPATHQTGEAIGTPGEYAWFTDLSVPVRDALGLTSTILACDRTAHRYRVTDVNDVMPWTAARRVYTWGPMLESAPGARPRHWFVATEPVSVVYDPIAARAAS